MALLTSIVIPVLSLVAVFLFSIQKFSKHVHRMADDGFKSILSRATATPLRGIFVGAGFAALIHSSTATTVILAGLVNAGILSFQQSLGVIFGANIGTTITSQLIALKLTSLAPYLVLLGSFLAYFGRKYRSWGKPIFYFGLVFFSLSLISLYIDPLRSDPSVLGLFSRISSIYIALLVGFAFTAVIQSSTVTSSLAVLLVATGLLDFEQAVGIILGANLGTTATVLIVSTVMNRDAKRVALAHFLFNFLGLLILLPFFSEFAAFVSGLGGSTEQKVATAHFLFNFGNTVLFLPFIGLFSRIVRNVVR